MWDGWRPYESADDDLMVLKAVREKWKISPRSDDGWFFSEFLRRALERRRAERKEKGSTDAVHYERGDYTDAAAAVLEGK